MKDGREKKEEEEGGKMLCFVPAARSSSCLPGKVQPPYGKNSKNGRSDCVYNATSIAGITMHFSDVLPAQVDVHLVCPLGLVR